MFWASEDWLSHPAWSYFPYIIDLFKLPDSFPLQSGKDSWRDNKLASFPGNRSEASFPGKNDIDLTFDGRQNEDIELTVSSSWWLHWGGSGWQKMKRLNFKSRYQFISLLHELLYFFISSLMLFPSHVKRIIFCIVYLENHHSPYIYPTLEEEIL